ncbi:MAG TPA: DNA internalization-related competence protein ComEC/Rec2 [Coriobacteriia bacterium]|nr:DNA internalization-related competence protein ComEC/Rec2 [Coriobacteriia bacterium]
MPDHDVIRPSIPPVWWAAAGLWAGVWLAEELAWRAFARAGSALGTGVVCVVLVAAAVYAAWRRQRSAVLLVGLAAGALCGAFFWWTWIAQVRGLDADAPSRWQGEVVSDATPGAFGESSSVRVTVGRRKVEVRVGWPRGEKAPEAGGQCSFFGSFRAPRTDEQGRRKFRSGVVGSVSARMVQVEGGALSLRGLVRPWRHRWMREIGAVRGNGGALLAGVVLGERSRLTGTPAESAFRTTGLTHLVAVSGGHLVVVAALVAWLLTRLRARRGVMAVAVVAITGIYVVISGVQPSAVRAWLMSAVLAASLASGRRADGVAALSGAVWIALAFDPSAAFDLGMQLSVLSVAGLLLFARLSERWVTYAVPSCLKSLASPVSLTLVAQAATVPLTASVFGVVSLIAPVANLLVSPLVSVLLVVGIAGLGTASVMPAAGTVVLRGAGAIGALATGIAEWLAGLPHAAVPLGWTAAPASCAAAGIAATAWAAWPQPTRRRARVVAVVALAALVFVSVGVPVPRGTEIVVLDVGQGDAILVRDGASAVLVDAGPDETALRTALLRQHVRRLDAVVITHLHDDHYGGIGALEGVIPVGAVYVPAGSLATGADTCEGFRRVGKRVLEIDAGDVLVAGRWQLMALWPQAAVPDAATNEASVVLAVRRGSFDALLTGDAESAVLESVVASGGLGDIEALKVGHHGSAEAVDERVLAVACPEYALISVGAGNRFGHPVASTMRQLETAGCRILRTDEDGDLVVRTDGERFSVSAARERR